jgi:hypothetical protein
LWALFLSYEYRNLAVALPMIGMASGVAVESWLARLSQPRDSGRALRIPTYGVVVVLVLALALFTVAVDAEQIIRQQIAAQRLIFEPAINDKLYRYFSSSGGPQSVISGYPVGWLPDLEDYWVNFRFNDYVVYKETLATHPHAELLLVRTDNSDARILAEIQAGIDVGDYQLIFTEANYILVHIPSGE